MRFTDYQGSIIELSEQVWNEHIKIGHPEFTEEIINMVLGNPDEVWISQNRKDVELYYSKKDDTDPMKVRYWMVAVKKIPTGNFVRSAMTKSKIVGAQNIFKKP
jgi:hypothetical protein